jgi:BTB/POZ domain/WD domain, G-beta repeat
MNKKDIIEMEVIMSEITDTKVKVNETIEYWQNVLDELDRRAKEYETLLMTFKAREAEDKKGRDSVESAIKLNLRGQVFDTTKDTIVKFNNTYFTTLILSPSFELDEDGEFFIDRNSHCFDRILEYMSTGELSTGGLNSYDKGCLYDNLKYFKIPHKSRVWDYSQVSLIGTLKLDLLLRLQDGRVCGTKDDYSISIYNVDTDITETSLMGHTYYINGIIQLEDGRLCTCSADRTIKLWNIDSGQCQQTIVAHTRTITCVMQLIDGRICSGSWDKTVKIWSKDTGVCELTINTLDLVFSIVQLKDGRICTGHCVGRIKLWNLSKKVCEMTFTVHAEDISAMVVIDKLRICSSSSDNTIIVWKVNTGVCEQKSEEGTQYIIALILLLDGRLSSVSTDGTLTIWDLSNGECVSLIQVCNDGLYGIAQLHDGRLAVSASNGNVYILGE